MVLEIPYSFIPGTKAKANEVNSNFNAVKTFVDTNEADIATNQSDIMNLQNNKADLNGDISNRFQVANPTGEYDAVNKQYFMDNIANTLDYIGGFKLSIQGDTSISASAGSCWDSTHEFMITSATALTKDQSNLGQNATYYVYVCADEEGGSNELVFSLSNSTPELPSGYDYFRMLGSFTTDSSGNIKDVFSNSNSVTQADIKNIANGAMPNYSSAIEKSLGTSYVAETSGYVSVQTGQNNNATTSVTVDGFLAYYCAQWKYVQGQRIMVPVPSGSTYIVQGSNVVNIYWIPCVGG